MIETERLALRRPLLSDADPLGAGVDRLRAWLAEWEANDIGYFTVLRGDEIVGRVGFHVFDAQTWELARYDEAGDHAVTELGWTLVPEHRGRGYATEAALAARAWAARDRLISLIEPANAASIRVAERLGATPGATVEIAGDEHVIWEHP